MSTTTQTPANPTRQRQKQQPPSTSSHTKLAKLPKNATLSKRPLQHAPIPSTFSGPNTQKVIYLSTRTPFLSCIKRVEKHLSKVEARETQSAAAEVKNKSRKRKYGDEGGEDLLEVAKVLAERKSGDGIGGEGEGQGLGREEVVVKATGRAISKALEVGVWFLKREKEGFGVQVRTGSVCAIDDIEVQEEEKGEEDGNRKEEEEKDGEGDESMKDMDTDVVDKQEEGVDEVKEEIPETRIRMLSTVEIAIYRT